jgi:hypothetical protein
MVIANIMQRVRAWWGSLIMLALVGLFATAAAPATAQIEQTCFAQTGFCIEGRIGQFWAQNGGLITFGYPIRNEEDMQIDGRTYTAQWFERARIELHPENAAPFDVLLGHVGAERLAQMGRDWTQFPRSQPQLGCQFVAQTGHNICGPIKAIWQSRGLDLYGQPQVTDTERTGLWGLPLSDLSPRP